MSTAIKTVEQMKILHDMGTGLLNRLYHLKGWFISKRKPQCLADPELSKVRARLEKKFPAPPAAEKTPGWDLFVNTSPRTLQELQEAYDLLLDICDFTTHSKQTLKDITLSIVDFKLSRNRNLTTIYFDLLVTYIKVLKMLELVEERVVIVAMYTAACSVSRDMDKDHTATRTNKLKGLLADCTDLTRHLIDFFAPSLVFARPMLLQLRDAIALMDRTEELRRDYTLNPINEEGNMALPTLKLLNNTTPVAVCTELASLERYYEYVAYAFVAFPALLYQEPCVDLLRLVAANRVVVELFRDVSLNIHLELERISLQFPGPGDNPSTLQLPKGAKRKDLLKGVSRASVGSAGLRQKERRSFLETELSNLNRLLTAAPGLLGPKFPMLLTCAALAKGEAVSYFRHAEGFAVRKDTKSHYSPTTYVAEDIASLLGEVHTAARLVQRHRAIVTNYYAEFLTNNDVATLRKLIAQCGDNLESIQTYTTAMLAELETARATSPSTTATTTGTTDASTVTSHTSALQGFRLNAERVMAVCSSQVMSQAIRAIGPAYDSFTQRLLFVYDRSLYCGALDQLLDAHLDFHQIGWFRTSFRAAFQTALLDPHGHARHTWLFFLPLEHIRKSAHAECPEEVPEMCAKAGAIANAMLSDIGANAATLVRFLWDNHNSLQAQHHPTEVGRRAERYHQAKQRGGAVAAAAAAAQETLPGSESEVWAKKQIENFVLIQQHLCWLFASAREKGRFVVHNLEYDPEVYLKEQVVQYFVSRMRSLFAHSEQAPLRFSNAFRRLLSGCLAVQHVLRLLKMDVTAVMQDVFFSEFQDSAQVPPPGLPVPVFVNLDREKLIYKIGLWFSDTAQQIARSGSGLVWVPSLQMFVNVNSTHPHGASSNSSSNNGSTGLAVEAHLGKDELRQLVTMIGVQGVRAVESQLLTLVADELGSVRKFIADNRNYLRQFEKNYCLVLNAAVDVRKNDSVFEAMRTIGVVLHIRDMLHAALRECCSLSFGDMQSALQAGAESLDYCCAPTLALPLACVAADLGLPLADCDLALAAALTKLDLSADPDVLDLLPVVAAALFVSEKWERTSYLSTLGAFENNEHCIQMALTRLFTAFFLLRHTALGGHEESDPLDAIGGGGGAASEYGDAEGSVDLSRDGVRKVCKRLSVRDRYHHYVERYLRIAAQTLLVQRENETKASKHAPQLPHRSMTIALEYFAALNPGVGRGALEKYLPNYLIHSDVLDVSLGRHRAADQLRPFVHPAATQAEAVLDYHY